VAFDATIDLLFVIDLLLCEELRRFDQRELEDVRRELFEHGERYVPCCARKPSGWASAWRPRSGGATRSRRSWRARGTAART
jgi:hypothetical protein